MRLMLMHSMSPAMEAGLMPTAEATADFREMIMEMVGEGAFLVGEGLKQTALGVRIDFTGGKRTVRNGPFPGERELTAAICIVRVDTIEEGVEWATRFAAIIGDCRIDIRPLIEPWDMGMWAKPADQRFTRYMLVLKASPATEAGQLPDAGQRAAVASLIAEMTAADVYQVAELVRPSREARRIKFTSGEARTLDGPFTESKELVAGFLLLDLPSVEGVMRWVPHYGRAVVDGELDILPLYEPGELE